MKRIASKVLVITFFLMGMFSFAFAQKDASSNNNEKATKEERQIKRAEFREKLTQTQIAEINKSLNLDNAAAVKFEKLYRAYMTEANTYRTSSRQNQPEASKDMSNEDADKIIRNHFERQRKLNDIREKHYANFKTVLSSKQILTVYRIENEMQQKLQAEYRQRIRNKK